MKHFQNRVIRYIASSRDAFRFNTKGAGFKEDTFFYFNNDNKIVNEVTFNELVANDAKRVWSYLKQHHDIIFNRNTDLQSVQIDDDTYIVNEMTITAASHVDALEIYTAKHPQILDT